MARPYILEQVRELFYGAPQATKGERSAQKTELGKRVEAWLAEQGLEDDDIGYGKGVIGEVLDAEVRAQSSKMTSVLMDAALRRFVTWSVRLLCSLAYMEADTSCVVKHRS
jgi:hypothetical protein